MNKKKMYSIIGLSIVLISILVVGGIAYSNGSFSGNKEEKATILYDKDGKKMMEFKSENK